MMFFLKVLVLPIIFLILILRKQSIASDSSTLKALFVVSRHGARAPSLVYDAVNETAWPNGMGQLTDRGKWQTHRIGEVLRIKYPKFLSGSMDEVEFRSARLPRIIESAQMIWKGLSSNACNRIAVPIRVDQVSLTVSGG